MSISHISIIIIHAEEEEAGQGGGLDTARVPRVRLVVLSPSAPFPLAARAAVAGLGVRGHGGGCCRQRAAAVVHADEAEEYYYYYYGGRVAILILIIASNDDSPRSR